MAGQCLDKLPHSCGTLTGLQVFKREEDDTVDGYCFACETYVRHPYGEEREVKNIPKPKQKTEEEIAAEIEEIDSYQTVSLPSRRLKKENLEHFGVKIGLNENDGKTPQERYYPYMKDGKITGYKVKAVNSKTMWSIGDVRDCDFFGWKQASNSPSNRRLIVVEGEDDAVALKQIIDEFTKEEYEDIKPVVVSLTSGSSAAGKDFARQAHKLKRFKDVVLAFDNDKAGEKATKDVLTVFPSAIVAQLPEGCKDANDAILEGYKKQYYNAVQWNAAEQKNTSLILMDDLFEAAMEPPKWGELTWPWEHINETTRGIRYGETIYIGAGVKMGKSEIVNALAAHFIKKHDIKLLMAKPEESNLKSTRLLAGKMVGRVFHDPKVEFDVPKYKEAIEMIKGHVKVLDLYQHVGWSSLRQEIIAAHAWGAKAVFIDPITNLTNGISSDKANTLLEEIAQDLSAMALDLDIVIFIFCHLKAPDGNLSKDARQRKYKEGVTWGLGNCPHEYGGDVYSNQFAGSRAMMRKCNYMIGVEGNKDTDLPEEKRNQRNLKLLEDREFGESGNFKLRWSRDTTLFSEI